MNILTKEFLDNYPDMPDHMTELGSFVFYRTYSRWLPKLNRRETWKEAVQRTVEYNISISLSQYKKNKYVVPIEELTTEAEELFDNIFNLKQFLSGRTHWVGGAESGVANKFPLSNFNCAFINITEWKNLIELFYLLLIGTGVGIKCTPEMADKLPPIRDNFILIHSKYNQLQSDERLEHTKLNIMPNGYAKIYIGDSKEGWAEALDYFFNILTLEKYNNIHTIKISYNSIRPKGERLKTFGGTASGPEPMKEMFTGIEKVIKNKLDPDYHQIERVNDEFVKVKPIHILDISNLIGCNVVVGGVRRTAEVFAGAENDDEIINAKDKINEVDYLHHRRMSNNAIAFETKPTRKKLHNIFTSIRKTGEPNFINLEAARKRRPNAEGLNPCGEVILDSHGVCNLTTVNVKAFVKDGILDLDGLIIAQRLSVRAAIRMTLLELEINSFNKTQIRDRLTGCSLTGWEDAMDKINWNKRQQSRIKKVLKLNSHQEAIEYAKELRIPTPLLVTTIKPEGTLSQVAGGVSSGIHKSFAPYYIRRIRINALDPLAKVAMHLGWNINPEVGTPKGEKPRTLVIDFPIKSDCTTSRKDLTAKEQIYNYFNWLEHYTDHNPSVTIYVRENEWEEVEQLIWDNWDRFIGMTFLPYEEGSYELAPYEEITEEEYYFLKSKMKPFNPDLLSLFESKEISEDIKLDGVEECESGVCGIR